MSTYETVTSGEPFELDPKVNYLKLGCCDCGLVHTMDINPESDGKLKITFFRENRATGQRRRRKKFVCQKVE